MKLDAPIQFDSFPALKELGDWLSTSTHMWSCHSTMYKYNREKFEKKFLEITKLTADHVLISIGGVGFNFMSPGGEILYKVVKLYKGIKMNVHFYSFIVS